MRGKDLLGWGFEHGWDRGIDGCWGRMGID